MTACHSMILQREINNILKFSTKENTGVTITYDDIKNDHVQRLKDIRLQDDFHSFRAKAYDIFMENAPPMSFTECVGYNPIKLDINECLKDHLNLPADRFYVQKVAFNIKDIAYKAY